MITHRRTHIDNFLIAQKKLMYGDILDIGGKKDNKRGSFRPPISQVASWKYVNIDKSTNPDFCCSADSIPLPNDSIDGILLCEVLEHLANPEEVISEAYRLLKTSGIGWITMPFLNQVHPDPYDYQRWTDIKLKQVLEEVGFNKVEIYPMGAVIEVIHDLYYCALMRSPKKEGLRNKIGLQVYKYSFNVISKLDKYVQYTAQWMTTGWAVIVKK